MTPIADMIERMLADNVPIGSIIDAVRTIETVTLSSRDASRDGRDGKALAAERARQYRARQRDKSGMAGHVARETSQKSSRDASRSERDAALILSSSSLLVGAEEPPKEVREKKERARRKIAMPLPDDWQPSPMHHAKAKELKLPAGCLEGKAEDMRLWAQANDIRKVNWDATFHGFLRRAVSEIGGSNGHRGPRPLQDDSKSISRAGRELAEAARRGEFSFGPRPSLLPGTSESPVQLLPKG